MAQATRKVKRAEGSLNRSSLAIVSAQRKPYELPDYVKDILVQYLGWIVLIVLAITAPVAILGIVLGAHALPLEFVGVPGTDNGVGFNIIAPIGEAVLLALAIRPLFKHERKGWWLVLAASVLFLANQIYLGHGISSSLLFLAVLYLYMQTRRRYK